MRKIHILFILTLCLLISWTSVMASADTEKIEISFKTGEDSLNINGKEVKVEKPYIVNGITLVPLRVITEAFGSKVDWNGEERSVTLSYKDIVIKLTVDSKETIVNGEKVNIPESPAIVNNTTMVPIRFITENFGAVVEYNNESGEIKVVKELSVNDGIQDFSEILKKTSSEKVGDSYHKWSILLPENVKLSYRNFSGTYNEFKDYDETYYLYVNITEAKNNDTINSLLAEELEYISNYTLVSQGKVTTDGQEYVKVVYKDSEGIYEDRISIKDEKVFIYSLEVSDEKKYKNNNEIATLLDSFKTEFVSNESINDLSNVTEDGYRIYENEKLKWSVNVLADWKEANYDNKVNEIGFSEDYKANDLEMNGINVKMTSKKDGLNLDKWLDEEEQYFDDNYNDELVKILKIDDAIINGKKSKKMYSSMKLNDKVLYACEAYLIGKNYKYQVYYIMNSKSYNDLEMRAKIEKMIDSFVFEDPDVDEVGQLIDVNDVSIEEGTREIKNEELKWAFEIPFNWTSDYGNNDSYAASYSLNRYHMNMKLIVNEKVSSEEYKLLLEELENSIRKMSDSSINIKEFKDNDIKDKGATIKKFQYKAIANDMVYNITNYILRKNGNVYIVTFGIGDITSSKRNEKIIDDIWKSFKFE